MSATLAAAVIARQVPAMIGVPVYLNGYAAIPTTAALLALGMTPGAALATLSDRISGQAIATGFRREQKSPQDGGCGPCIWDVA